MTTSEPPEHRPTPPGASDHQAPDYQAPDHAAPDHPAPEHAVGSESPTEQLEPSGEPAATDGAGSGAVSPVAAGAGAGAFAAQPRSTRSGSARWNPRGWSRRRRWIGLGVLLILILLIIALICGISRHHRYGHRHGHGHHGHSAFHQGMPDGGMGLGGTGMGGPGGGRDREGGPMANMATLNGSVVSVAPGSVVVAQDGAGQVTVPTTDRTRMMGAGNGLTGLQPGQRVVVRLGADKSAVAVFSPKARAVGTITAIAGDRATLVRLDGLTEPVDLSAVNPKPANGDVVAVSGTAAENGAALKVDTLRVMP
jgi:hypothetical protein